jgi:hypothetical protein
MLKALRQQLARFLSWAPHTNFEIWSFDLPTGCTLAEIESGALWMNAAAPRVQATKSESRPAEREAILHVRLWR